MFSGKFSWIVHDTLWCNLGVLLDDIKHKQDKIRGNWESSSSTEHTKECTGQFNWIYPRTITIMPSMYKRKVREAGSKMPMKQFEIQSIRSGLWNHYKHHWYGKAKQYIKKKAYLYFYYLKLVSAIFYPIFIFLQNDSPLKTMKNVFYFV